MDDNLPEYTDPAFTDDDSSESPPTDIVAYNELRSCADLARMKNEGTINLQPDFQRDVVWNSVNQTRFIDSLVKQLPIPSMCFALDHKSDTWIVIDGLQRMTAIVRFIDGGDWRLANLEDIDSRLSGKRAISFKEGSGDNKKVFDRVQNKTIPITVLRCDFSKKSHMEYLFTVFHRLNSGGTKLNNQEIRNCIYSGSLNELLRELDRYPNWRKFNRMAPVGPDGSVKNYRFVKQEIILRFFAFLENGQKYNGQIGKFLNDYMHSKRRLDDVSIDKKRQLFARVIAVIDGMFPDGPDNYIPTAVNEAILVAFGRNIDHVENISTADLCARYQMLRASEPFSEEGLAEGLSKTEKVSSRLQKANEIYAA